MFTPIAPDELERLIRKHYQFLKDDFDFSINKISDYKFVAESSVAKLHFDVEHAVNLVIEMEPVGEGAKLLLQHNITPNPLSIISIFYYYDPNLEYKVEMIDEENLINNIPLELERRASLVRKYCSKMLRGDFADWVAVKENILARRRSKKI